MTDEAECLQQGDPREGASKQQQQANLERGSQRREIARALHSHRHAHNLLAEQRAGAVRGNERNRRKGVHTMVEIV